MARYIGRPRGRLISAGDSLATVSLSPEARAAQLESVRSVRNTHPALVELGRWLKEQSNSTVRSVSTEAPIMGTLVLDMEENHAAQIPTIADLLVIEDRPLDLIRPRRASGTKKRLATRDLWHLKAIGLTRARGAKFVGDGAGVAVAVLDTGIDSSHPEFQGKTIEMVTFDVNRGTPHSSQPSIDTEGHGTHVAGLLAGRRVGVAPSATIINGTMIPNAKGTLAHFVLALEWAASRADIAIVNMSAGIPGYVEGMEDAVADLGVSADRQGAGVVQVSAAIVDDLDQLSGSYAMASRPKRRGRSVKRSDQSWP